MGLLINNKTCMNVLLVFVLLIQCGGVKNECKIGAQSAKTANREVVVQKDSLSNLSKTPGKSSIVNSKFPVDSILGIWTIDPTGSNADFELNKEYYFIADFDGNGNMVYTVRSDSFVVYMPEITSRGIITKACADSLQVNWTDQGLVTYTRFKK